jgi:hypothetical protein
MKDLLQSRSPDLESLVEIALKQERLQNEKKNQKILEMFQVKDNAIRELEIKFTDLEVIWTKHFLIF